MKVINPVVITPAMLISSTAPETEHAVYSAVTNYGVGARSIYLNQIFESVQTPNTGNTPGTNALYWALIAPTNRWLMFDQEVSSKTVLASPLTVVVAAGALVDSIALLDISGAAVSITVRDGLAGPVVYSFESTLDGSVVADWYQYFYQPFVLTRNIVLTNLPLYGSAHITVSLTGTGQVQLGSMVVGAAYDLGGTKYGATVGIRDFSRKDTNAVTGVTTFVKRKNSKRISASLVLKNFDVDNVYRTLEGLTATPCVWVGTDVAGLDVLTGFGFYTDFSIDIAYPTESLCSIEIEGLI